MESSVDTEWFAGLRVTGSRSLDLELEVLKKSGRLWAINSMRIEPWVCVTRGATTAVPDHAAMAARYTRPVETPTGTHLLHQRSLSVDEIRELGASGPRLRWWFVALACYVNVAAGFWLFEKVVRDATEGTGMVAIAAAAWFDYLIGRWFSVRRRLARDVAGGFVVIYRMNASDGAPSESVVEFLPQTGMEWTRSGIPSRWRRAHGRASAVSGLVE